MIYFDNYKNAYAYIIPNFVAATTDEEWAEVASDPQAWDIKNGIFINLKNTKDYINKQAQAREENFKKQFFNIEGFGWFRKQPKGYASALEAVNTALNMVGILGLLPAGSFTFYIAPDFYKENQCTEEWLVANSFKNNSMTAAEFGKFYADFVTAWNREEHL